MTSKAAKGLKLMYLPKKGPFDNDVGSRIPETYKKFYREWKWMQPAAVHHIPPTKQYERDVLTGEIKVVQDQPIPVLYPREHNTGLWGGEGVVKGFQKRHPLRRRVPHFWVPALKSSVVHSEVLDKHISVVVTERLLRLVHENCGFDHYLLKTPACDLKSELALKLKRQILLALANKDLYHDDPRKREDVLSKYQHYLADYDPEYLEWYGLTLDEAFRKQLRLDEAEAAAQVAPLKRRYRLDLLERLREAGVDQVRALTQDDNEQSWLSKINPFSKKGDAAFPKN